MKNMLTQLQEYKNAPNFIKKYEKMMLDIETLESTDLVMKTYQEFILKLTREVSKPL